ncbi:hypothetical protein ACMBCN_01860 [Candidatus Liberibacter asiaticus]|nr:hypothetical protein [Candidatus Liberibacter asiaticus]
MRDRPWRLLVTFLRVIRTLASTKFTTSSFCHRCRIIDILNNFLFNFLEFLNYIYLFIYFIYYLLFIFILLYLKKN